MNRSLLILLIIGVLGMTMLAALGSVFVGKVGGADRVGALRGEMAAIYGRRMADPAGLSVSVVQEGGVNGLRVAFTPAEPLAGRPAEFDKFLARMASFVFEREPRRKAVGFVLFDLPRTGGGSLSRRIDRP